MKSSTQINSVYLIPVINDFIIYSPLVGITAFINRGAVNELQKQLLLIENNLGNPSSKLFELATDIMMSPVRSPIRKTGNLNPEFLGILPTRSCNGACNYCDFGADRASGEKMSYRLAADVVDWYARILKSQNRNSLEIHFFGGEPMVARDVIEVVVQRARLVAAEQNLIPFFEISTNGQYDAHDAGFLAQYFNKVVLSLDGSKEVQDKHRPLKTNKSSFENAVETARIISHSGADLCIRCCVSQTNLLQMEEFTEWLCRNFRLAAINFEILSSTSQTDLSGLYPPDPVEFAVHFQRSRKIAERYGVEVVYASDISDLPVVSSCPVGKDAAIVSSNGRISNCYLMPEKWQEAGLDLDFGNINSDGEVNLEADKLNAIRIMVESKPRCIGCFCQWSCAGGCHVGITYPGCHSGYDNFCKQTRLISAFTLMSGLGMQDKIEELINTPDAMHGILNQISDHIMPSV